MVEISISYLGNLRTEAQHGPSGATIITDAPVDNHGKGEAFSPSDLAATSLGACMATIMGIVAQRKNIDLTGLTVKVQKTMSTDAPRRIAHLAVHLSMPLLANHPERNLLESSAMSCPVYHSLHPDIQKDIQFHYDHYDA